ncbi:hypothetical protein ACWJJH_04850 [Endozoicomonadaceae bacterium StTr2]
MSGWQLVYDVAGNEHEINLIPGGHYQLPETAAVQFRVRLSDQDIEELGEPSLLLGGDLLELAFIYRDTDGLRVFGTPDIGNRAEAQLFYNAFGDIETKLVFAAEPAVTLTVMIAVLARPANAEVASTMFEYISRHIDDVTTLCFSSTVKGRQAGSESGHQKIRLLGQIVEFLTAHQTRFIRQHPVKWEERLGSQKRGQPSGPDSVFWALSHLDQLSPAPIEQANLCFQNRGYRFEELPDETRVENTDVEENRVIHGFLAAAIDFLHSLRISYQKQKLQVIDAAREEGQDFISFNQTLNHYRESILKYQLSEIEELLLSTERLRRQLLKRIPAKVIPGLKPVPTAWVLKHPHYRHLFEWMADWYGMAAPKQERKELLLGMKNLTLVYELVCLIHLVRLIQEEFDVVLERQSWQQHGIDSPFGGVTESRPAGKINNLFIFSGAGGLIELFYEPRIYPFSDSSRPGDLIDISDVPCGDFESHFFCPDFVIRIRRPGWSTPLVAILDAKYSNAGSIKRHSLNSLTQKYLLGIQQLSSDECPAMTPVKMLLLLFAHGQEGNIVSLVSARHQLTGELPVLPQSAGLLFLPERDQIVRQWLQKLQDLHDRSEKAG